MDQTRRSNVRGRALKKLHYSPKARKNFLKLHPDDQKRVKKKLEQLSIRSKQKNLDLTKLKDTNNSFRLRVGDVRIIFEEIGNNIYLHNIDYRGKVYK